MATEIARYEVPEGRIFRFEKFGLDWSAGASGNLTFTVYLDTNKPCPGYENFKYQPGALSDLEMNDVNINVKGPAIVSIVATNSSITTDYTAGARIKGGLVEDL